VFGAGMALGRRVLASNAVNLLHAGFKACDSYAGGEAAMAALTARCCSCWASRTR
jgi:hypothetical protein